MIYPYSCASPPLFFSLHKSLRFGRPIILLTGGMGKGKGKMSAETKPEQAITVSKSTNKMRIRYSTEPYSWLVLFLSPEVVLSMCTMAVSTYFLINYPSEVRISDLVELCKSKSEYYLKNREQEKHAGAPTTLPTDLILCLIACLSSCCFMSSCCRVVMKAQESFSKQKLEEALRMVYDDDLREEQKKNDQKVYDEVTAVRAKKKLSKLQSFISTTRIEGEDVVLNMIVFMCIVYAIVLTVFVLYKDINEVRGFGVIVMYALLIAGVVLPKVHNTLLTLQHFCGLVQNVLIGLGLYLIFLAVSEQ